MPVLSVVDCPPAILDGIQTGLQAAGLGWEVRVHWCSTPAAAQRVLEDDSIACIAALHWPHAGHLAPVLQTAPLPVVSVLDSDGVYGGLPILIDEDALAATAIQHLRASGARHIAWCGQPAVGAARRRAAALRQTAAAQGIEMVELAPADDTDATLAWRRTIDALPGLVGALAFNDTIAARLVAACSALVPQRLVVLGVNDDERFCPYAPVPLSSIPPDHRAMGRIAVTLLDEWIRTGRPPESSVVVPPLAVRARASTRPTASDEALFTQLQDHLQRHLADATTIDAIAAGLGCSRSSLQRCCTRHAGTSPAALLQRMRLDAARERLRTSDEPVGRIAEQCGFRDASAFTRAFRRRFGVQPRRYREDRESADADGSFLAD